MKKKTALIIAIFIIINITAQVNFQWANGIGGNAGNDHGYAISSDSGGNIYTTGTFEGTVDFDPGVGVYTLSASNQEGIFISKLDASGNFIWAKCLGGANSFGDYSNSLALDASGNIYTTGYYYGIEDFDPGPGVFTLSPSSSYGDVFISKLDQSGNFIWAKSLGSTDGIGGFGIVNDLAGNVYITGYFFGTADFDPGSGVYNLSTSPSNQEDIFVCKLDASGNFIWAKSMGGSLLTGDGGLAIAVDVIGNVYTTGYFTGTADFDPGVGSYYLTSLGNRDVFISKLDVSGNFSWAKQIGGSGTDNGFSLTLDASGNIYTTGTFTSTVDFDPGIGTYTLTSSGGYNTFVSKLDPSGNFIWAKNFWGSSNDIAVDASGNVYTTGGFNGSGDLDPGAGIFNFTSVGQTDIFISKLDASGTFVWAQQVGGIANDVSNSIVVDAAGYVFLTGGFNNTADFDPGAGSYNLTSLGAYDVFILKLNCAVGIKDNFLSGSSFTLYPNPTSTTLFINSEQNEFSNSEIEIINSIGQTILKMAFKKEINVSELTQGFYNLKITTSHHQTYFSKFIKE